MLNEDATTPSRKWESGRKHWIAGTVIALCSLAVGVTSLVVHFGDGSKDSQPPNGGQAPSLASQPSTDAHPDGSGPERTTFTRAVPASYAVLNSITDAAGIGDERNFTRVRRGDEFFQNATEANIGDIVTIVVHVNNDCADNLAGPAATMHGLWMRLVPQQTANASDITFQVFLGADNAMTVWDGATVIANAESHLEILPGTAKMDTYTSHGFAIDADGLAQGKDIPLGQDKPDGEFPVGEIPGQPGHDLGTGYVEFKAQVVAGK